jgi:hypothetical protein
MPRRARAARIRDPFPARNQEPAVRTHVICPSCQRRLATLVSPCPDCAADLSPLVALRDLADRHFNQAVQRVRLGHWNLAAESLAVVLALDTHDLEAQALLETVRSHQPTPVTHPVAPVRGPEPTAEPG